MLRRTSLERRTPMRRTWMRRGRRRNKYARRARDFDYMGWIKTQPCAARFLSPCNGIIEADHAGRRGIGQKAADETCIALCTRHHAERGDFSGPFKSWNQERMRGWLVEQIQDHKHRYPNA